MKQFQRKSIPNLCRFPVVKNSTVTFFYSLFIVDVIKFVVKTSYEKKFSPADWTGSEREKPFDEFSLCKAKIIVADRWSIIALWFAISSSVKWSENYGRRRQWATLRKVPKENYWRSSASLLQIREVASATWPPLAQKSIGLHRRETSHLCQLLNQSSTTLNWTREAKQLSDRPSPNSIQFPCNREERRLFRRCLSISNTSQPIFKRKRCQAKCFKALLQWHRTENTSGELLRSSVLHQFLMEINASCVDVDHLRCVTSIELCMNERLHSHFNCLALIWPIADQLISDLLRRSEPLINLKDFLAED